MDFQFNQNDFAKQLQQLGRLVRKDAIPDAWESASCGDFDGCILLARRIRIKQATGHPVVDVSYA